MDKRSEYVFLQRKKQMANEHEKIFIISHQGKANQNYSEILFHTH
jgi:hypothetical protein